MELYSNMEKSVACAVKHGRKYPHAAIECLGLLETLAENSKYSLSDLCVATSANESSDAESFSLKKAIAEARNEIAGTADRSTPYLDAKYALHLLDRICISPFELQNEAMRKELDFVRTKLAAAKDEPKLDPGELMLAMKRADFLHDLLNWRMNEEAEKDCFAILNCESWLIFTLMKNGIPGVLLMDFWSHVSPLKYQGASDQLISLHRATAEELIVSQLAKDGVSRYDLTKYRANIPFWKYEDDDDGVIKTYQEAVAKLAPGTYLDYDESEFSHTLDICETVFAAAKKLSGFSDYGAHLRQAVSWCQRKAIKVAMEANYAANYANHASIRLGLEEQIERAQQLLREYYHANEAAMHVELDTDVALNMCGAYEEPA